MNYSDKYHYKCVNCGREYPADRMRYLCPECNSKNRPEQPPAGVLKVVYDYDSIKRSGKLFKQHYAEAFIDLLPIHEANNLPFLKVGSTPMYHPENGLLLKDDSQNPTFSFKDRASAMVSAWAKENGITKIIAASTGNAGSSLAGICAAQNQQAIIVVPQRAPIAKLTQILMYGAKLVPVKGTYDDAFDLSVSATEAFGWYNRNTAYNPLTVEGKKTVSFEIFHQTNGKLPDRIFVPVGDGVIVSGVYKGFEDLLNLGLINKIPEIVAVQAEGSNNLISNLPTATFEIKPSNTIADSISVDVPRNFHMAKKFIRQYFGTTLSVSDEMILEASSLLSKRYGIFTEPASAAAFAGFLKSKKNKNQTSLVLLTGSGLKDTAAVKSKLKLPKAIRPQLEELEKILS